MTEAYLERIYYDAGHPASFQGPAKLYQAVRNDGKRNITRKKINEWFQKQETYGLTRPARRKFERSHVVVEGIDAEWDCDLMDMAKLAPYNQGVRFVLLLIDIFSRFVWVKTLKTKNGKEVAEAMRSVFAMGRKPRMARSDRGGEFVNRNVRELLREENIGHILTNNETKAAYAERGIKTVKMKLFRYMLHKQTYRYVDVLPKTIQSYNSTKHSALGVAPKDVTKVNEDEIRYNQYLQRSKRLGKKPVKARLPKYHIGTEVRISHGRTVFDREYQQKWTGELFRIKRVYMREGIPVYKLFDWNGDEVLGTFYEDELQPVIVNENTMYKIEAIIKKRRQKGKSEVLVHWQNWPSKYDSWIPASDVNKFNS